MGIIHGVLLQTPIPPHTERESQGASLLPRQPDAVGLETARGPSAARRGSSAGKGKITPHNTTGLGRSAASAGKPKHGRFPPLPADDGVSELMLPKFPRDPCAENDPLTDTAAVRGGVPEPRGLEGGVEVPRGGDFGADHPRCGGVCVVECVRRSRGDALRDGQLRRILVRLTETRKPPRQRRVADMMLLLLLDDPHVAQRVEKLLLRCYRRRINALQHSAIP